MPLCYSRAVHRPHTKEYCTAAMIQHSVLSLVPLLNQRENVAQNFVGKAGARATRPCGENSHGARSAARLAGHPALARGGGEKTKRCRRAALPACFATEGFHKQAVKALLRQCLPATQKLGHNVFPSRKAPLPSHSRQGAVSGSRPLT